MEQKKHNIKFIKINGIIYAIAIISFFAYSFMPSGLDTSGGGNNGGGGGGGIILGAFVLGVSVFLTILNFIYSKPKPKDKYLRFLPIFIMIATALIAVAVTFVGLLNGLILLVGILFLFIKILLK